ncbi:MAG: glycosyltransferase family 39 protein [Anaerolineae bacterium]|nr:glycosyltransferase family 39 protein [Anaerolineae bacterium]
MKLQRWEYAAVAAIALLVGGLIALSIPGPAYTDACYYFNAGARLAAGDGLTDPYVALTYLGAPETLPVPSHTYWMPLASLIVAGAGGSFALAQVAYVLLWAALAVLAFWLGARLGGSRRHAWGAGLLVVFCGYYAPFLVTTDTFTPFGLCGALSLLALGLGRARGDWRGFALGGACAALAHLTRADGLLLVGVLGLVALWPERWLNRQDAKDTKKKAERLRWLLVGVGAYLLVMLPWFARNVSVIGSALPLGGTATIWLRGYDEIVNYPAVITAGDFFAWGVGNILASRWEAFTNNLGTFVAVEGLVVLAPLIVIGLGKRWREPLLLPVWLYAVALHVAMTLVFAYPGYRGGLFHSAAALLPWWMALGLLGLDDAVNWIAARRRHWRAATAQRFFTLAVLVIAAALTIFVTGARLRGAGVMPGFARLTRDLLPSDAVVMSNDPAALYYYTGRSGVVVPNGGPDVIRALVERYGVTHVLLDENRTAPLDDLYSGRVAPPDFLREVPQTIAPSVRLFEVVLP